MSGPWAQEDERAWAVLEKLREELEPTLGVRWQSEAARRIGVHQSTVNKIWNRTRGAGKTVIGAMVNRLNIDANYFSGDAAADSVRVPKDLADYAARNGLTPTEAIDRMTRIAIALEASGTTLPTARDVSPPLKPGQQRHPRIGRKPTSGE